MLNIREPFWSAAQKYKWPYKSAGIGVKYDVLQNQELEDIKITVGDDPQVYVVNRERALDLVDSYKAYYEARGTKLGIIPLQIFTKEENVARMSRLF